MRISDARLAVTRTKMRNTVLGRGAGGGKRLSPGMIVPYPPV